MKKSISYYSDVDDSSDIEVIEEEESPRLPDFADLLSLPASHLVDWKGDTEDNLKSWRTIKCAKKKGNPPDSLILPI